MLRSLYFATGLAILGGCATHQTTVAERDPVDSLIAQSAASAVQALRDLSETTGNSRVVVSAPKAAASASAQATPVAAAPKPAPSMQSIGSRAGSIGVETVAPVQVPLAAPAASSGIVASGGLLSAPPAGLERLITVRWTGELEELLAHVAQESGWTLAPATGFRVSPVVISISAENRTAFDVLRDIGAIAGAAAEIHVSAQTRTISVRYPKR